MVTLCCVPSMVSLLELCTLVEIGKLSMEADFQVGSHVFNTSQGI